jgi:hypothetical protein
MGHRRDGGELGRSAITQPMAEPFARPLSSDARVLVELEGHPLGRYAIMIQLRIEGRWQQTIRLLDNVHGDHDMHRYAGAEKQPAERFADGTVSEIAPMAIRYLIDHWEAQDHGRTRAQQIHRSRRDRQCAH